MPPTEDLVKKYDLNIWAWNLTHLSNRLTIHIAHSSSSASNCVYVLNRKQQKFSFLAKNLSSENSNVQVTLADAKSVQNIPFNFSTFSYH